MTGPDPDGRFVRIGHTQFRFFMPHTAPSLPEHHLANARAVEQAINAIPVTTTQTVTWNLPTFLADGTPRKIGTLYLSPGTHKLHQIATALSVASSVDDAATLIDPIPEVIAAGGDGGGGSFAWSDATTNIRDSNVSGLIRTDVPMKLTISISVTCSDPTDTVVTRGAFILDPVSTT